MPIYEYQCERCEHQFEVMQRMSDDPLKTCPSCNEDALRKLISRVGFQLKGTGWYETDFKNKGKPESSKKEGKDGKEGGTSSDAGKDSKSDSSKGETGSSEKSSSASSKAND